VSTYFIQGYFNQNLGDDLMIKILIDKISKFDNKPRIVKLQGGHYRFSKIKIAYTISSIPFFSDFFIRIGGSVYQDFGYNSNIRDIERTFYICRALKACKGQRSKIVFINNSIGPITTEIYEKKMLKLLKMADYISVRDKYSYEYLSNNGIDSVYHPDSVFSLYNEKFQKRLKPSNDIFGISLLAFRQLYFRDNSGQYIINKNIADLIQTLLSENMFQTIYFFEFNAGTESDLDNFTEILNMIDQKLRSKIKIIRWKEENLEEFLGYMSQCSFFLANRFHSIVLALILKIPFIAIDHHIKVHNFLSDNNLEKFSVKSDELSEIHAAHKLIGLIKADNRMPRFDDKTLLSFKEEALKNFEWLLDGY
jgi:polysaccharide pyruvyl transferase WcaK-like protein